MLNLDDFQEIGFPFPPNYQLDSLLSSICPLVHFSIGFQLILNNTTNDAIHITQIIHLVLTLLLLSILENQGFLRTFVLL